MKQTQEGTARLTDPRTHSQLGSPWTSRAHGGLGLGAWASWSAVLPKVRLSPAGASVPALDAPRSDSETRARARAECGATGPSHRPSTVEGVGSAGWRTGRPAQSRCDTARTRRGQATGPGRHPQLSTLQPAPKAEVGPHWPGSPSSCLCVSRNCTSVWGPIIPSEVGLNGDWAAEAWGVLRASSRTREPGQWGHRPVPSHLRFLCCEMKGPALQGRSEFPKTCHPPRSRTPTLNVEGGLRLRCPASWGRGCDR